METITAELSKPLSSCCSSNFNFPTTTSTSRTVTINGSHEFKINGYSLKKGIGIGNSLSSDAFIAGGYQWAIHFYPDGRAVEDQARYVSLFIALESEDSDVRALFEISLIDQSGKGRNKVHTQFGRIGTNLESGPYTMKCRGSRWGFGRFFRRDLLEKSDYLKDDTLVIRCRVGVVVTYTEGVPLPDPDIGHNFGKSLESGSRNDSDVNFQVDGEEFAAQELKYQHTQSADSWSSSSVGNWKKLKRINLEEEETTEESDDAATRIFIFEPDSR